MNGWCLASRIFNVAALAIIFTFDTSRIHHCIIIRILGNLFESLRILQNLVKSCKILQSLAEIYWNLNNGDWLETSFLSCFLKNMVCKNNIRLDGCNIKLIPLWEIEIIIQTVKFCNFSKWIYSFHYKNKQLFYWSLVTT